MQMLTYTKVRDRADTQYGKLIRLYNTVPFILSVFMTNKTRSSVTNHCKSTESESGKMPKYFLSFF